MSKGSDNFTVGLDSIDSQLARVTLNKVVVKIKNNSFIKSLEDIERPKHHHIVALTQNRD